MCGIYGTTINYTQEVISNKLKRIDFRGPDKSAFKFFPYNLNRITLGHNRLAIIDLDPRSDQPFSYENHIHIVFNGEIFNYLELKRTLLSKQYVFHTESDTEVICAAYLEYGEECVSHFNGMFAFVIYDSKKEVFFGARDRTGQKPFYFYHNGLEFEFASQLSAITINNNHNFSYSESAIKHYLVSGYIPDPLSIYKNVKKLPAGHLFIYKLRTGNIKVEKYWDIDKTNDNQFKGSYHDAKDNLEELLGDAVSKRLIADVPLGIFLSGGVDSSLIAAMARKMNPGNIKTFAVKFNSKGFDESQYAARVANHLGTEHRTIECNYEEGIELIKNFHRFYDEPFADSSAIPSMLLAKHTKKHVTVALTGDAGDESFLGYHRYNWIRIAERYYKSPQIIRLILLKGLNLIPHYKSKVISSVLSAQNINEAYINMILGKGDIILGSDADDLFTDYKKYLFHDHKNIYERASDFDIKTYLNGDINTKVDRATMAYSLEARSPFLDYRVIELARSLPTSFKFERKNQKRILKDILYNYVPKEYFDRPKSGFTMPFKEWFRSDLKEYVLDELNPESLKSLPLVDAKLAQQMIDQHMSGSWNRYSMIWKLLVLKQWLKDN